MQRSNGIIGEVTFSLFYRFRNLFNQVAEIPKLDPMFFRYLGCLGRPTPGNNHLGIVAILEPIFCQSFENTGFPKLALDKVIKTQSFVAARLRPYNRL